MTAPLRELCPDAFTAPERAYPLSRFLSSSSFISTRFVSDRNGLRQQRVGSSGTNDVRLRQRPAVPPAVPSSPCRGQPDSLDRFWKLDLFFRFHLQTLLLNPDVTFVLLLD